MHRVLEQFRGVKLDKYDVSTPRGRIEEFCTEMQEMLIKHSRNRERKTCRLSAIFRICIVCFTEFGDGTMTERARYGKLRPYLWQIVCANRLFRAVRRCRNGMQPVRYCHIPPRTGNL